MPIHKYRKPKELVIQVYRGNELDNLLEMVLQKAFSNEGIKITKSKINRILSSLPESVLGGNPVLIIEQFPLNSVQAHGKYQDLVYQVVRKTGTQYTRKYTKSLNPRTPLQQTRRTKHAQAVSTWHSLSPSRQNQWRNNAVGTHMSGFNLFVSNYLKSH